MTNQKTGTAMGRIENTRKVKAIKCNCRKCCNAIRAHKTLYCSYYDIFSPHKTKCARYSPWNEEYNKASKNKAAVIQHVKKKPSLPWETPQQVDNM